MRVALILTGYTDDAHISFPHYLAQINGSKIIKEIGIFASVHTDRGHSIDNLNEFRKYFTGTKTFKETRQQLNLPKLTSRGHPSIAEFADAVDHWRDQLYHYDIVWRGRWDSYLIGDSETLDTQIDACWNLGGRGEKIDHQRHRVVSRSVCLNYGRPAMEGKHHWVTAHTAVAAFSNWEDKWTSWMDHIGDFRFNAHLTWAEVYASIGANIDNGKYSVERISEYQEYYNDEELTATTRTGQHRPVQYKPNIDTKPARLEEFRLRRAHRRHLLEEKIKSQNPH